MSSSLSNQRAELATVEQLLSLSPDDVELKRLRADLLRLIALTQQQQQQHDAAPPSAEQRQAPVAGGWKVGDRCKATWQTDGKAYLARIDKIEKAVGGGNASGVPDGDLVYSVTYLGYGNTGEVGEAALAPFLPTKKESLHVGLLVSALYEPDGLFYPAVVESVLPNGRCRVRYNKSQEVATLEAADVVVSKKAASAAAVAAADGGGGSAAAGAASSGGGGGSGGGKDEVALPMHLRVLPSDSEAEKAKKLAAIKRYKLVHRKREREEADLERVHTWQNFRAKKGVGDRSIFTSDGMPATVPRDNK